MNPDFVDMLRALFDAEVRFIMNKRAIGRHKDLADVDALEDNS